MNGVAHVLSPGTPVIALSSCALNSWHYDRFAIPMNPSYNPVTLFGQNENMDFVYRLGNWFSYHLFNFFYRTYNTPAADALIRHKFGQETPSTADLAKETTMMFVNTHFSLNGAVAYSPQVLELGGIHIQKAKPLPADIQKYLDSADNGVIVISWGSMIRAETLPADKRDGILKAIRRLKQKVIWKFENETLFNQPENLLISKWLPQREILCHPNVKAFMTHGGLMGTTEAVYCGVPTVITPIYGDQFLNSKAMEHREMGVILRFDDINENSVLRALKTVLDKKYQDNAKKVSYSYNHRPQKTLESAIWWVEYVAKTGGGLLKSRAPQMSAFEFYCLDIYLLFTVLILSLFFVGKILVSRLLTTSAPVPKKVKSH